MTTRTTTTKETDRVKICERKRAKKGTVSERTTQRALGQELGDKSTLVPSRVSVSKTKGRRSTTKGLPASDKAIVWVALCHSSSRVIERLKENEKPKPEISTKRHEAERKNYRVKSSDPMT